MTRFPGHPEDVLYEIDLEDMCEEGPSTWEDLASQRWTEFMCLPGETRESTTGEVLDPAKVIEGRDEEMGLMSPMHVWDRVTREQARQYREGQIVGARWVIVKNWDKVRCRHVAQELAGSDRREDMYAGTPPLSATKLVAIKRAFLHGFCIRSIHIYIYMLSSVGSESEGGEVRGEAHSSVVRHP